MTGERTDEALGRIDLALSRIEAATSRVETTLAGQARRNETLRQAVAESLRDLDSLINGTAGGTQAG